MWWWRNVINPIWQSYLLWKYSQYNGIESTVFLTSFRWCGGKCTNARLRYPYKIWTTVLSAVMIVLTRLGLYTVRYWLPECFKETKNPVRSADDANSNHNSLVSSRILSNWYTYIATLTGSSISTIIQIVWYNTALRLYHCQYELFDNERLFMSKSSQTLQLVPLSTRNATKLSVEVFCPFSSNHYTNSYWSTL